MAVKVGSFTKSTSTAPVAQVVSGIGFWPKALILWTAGQTSADTFGAGALFAMGFSTAPDASGSVAMASEDNAATSNTARRSAVAALTVVDHSGTTLAEAQLDSATNGAFTLRWTTNNATAYIIHYMAIGGQEVEDVALVEWAADTSAGNQAVTGAGFQPEVVLHLTTTLAAAGADNSGQVSIGAMDGSKQYVAAVGAQDGQADSVSWSYHDDGAAIVWRTDSGKADGVASLVSLDTDGFTVSIDDAPASGYKVYSLCIRGGDFYLGTYTTSGASTGNQAVTGVGFKPEGLLLFNTDAGYSTSEAAHVVLCVSATDGIAEQAALVVDEDNVGTTNTAGYSSASKITIKDTSADQSIQYQADIVSLDTGGFTVNNNDADATVVTVLAVRTGAVGLLDDKHKWELLVNGTDRWMHVLDGTLSWVETEGGEIGTLRATVQEYGAGLFISEWQEIKLKNWGSYIWGGYIVSATPSVNRLAQADRLTWDITAESYETLLNRTPVVRETYYNTAPGAILQDLFDQAFDPTGSPPAQTEFDTGTFVVAGSWSSPFTFGTDGEKLTDVIDRLAMLAACTFAIDARKRVHFGPSSTETAPFGIKPAGTADYLSFFPPLDRSVAKKVDASEIRNRITVHGGTRVSDPLKEQFTGDGSTLLFQLTYRPVIEITSIFVGGVAQTWGTDWYHSFDDYDCLVNYSHGTVRWDSGNAPPNGDDVDIEYRYGTEVVVTVDHGTEIGSSYARYGRWFDFEVVDRSITTLAAAQAVAEAMLDEYENGVTTAAFDVQRLGVRAGQQVQIEVPALTLTGYYAVRRVTNEVRRGGLVRSGVQVGGKRSRLTEVLGRTVQGGPVTPGARQGGGVAGAVDRTLHGRGEPVSMRLEKSLTSYGVLKMQDTPQSSSYSAAGVSVILADATSGDVTVTLPEAASSRGYVYIVAKTDSSGNDVILDGDGSETVNGATTYPLTSQYQAAFVYCDGSEWFVLATA